MRIRLKRRLLNISVTLSLLGILLLFGISIGICAEPNSVTAGGSGIQPTIAPGSVTPGSTQVGTSGPPADPFFGGSNALSAATPTGSSYPTQTGTLTGTSYPASTGSSYSTHASTYYRTSTGTSLTTSSSAKTKAKESSKNSATTLEQFIKTQTDNEHETENKIYVPGTTDGNELKKILMSLNGQEGEPRTYHVAANKTRKEARKTSGKPLSPEIAGGQIPAGSPLNETAIERMAAEQNIDLRRKSLKQRAEDRKLKKIVRDTKKATASEIVESHTRRRRQANAKKAPLIFDQREKAKNDTI